VASGPIHGLGLEGPGLGLEGPGLGLEGPGLGLEGPGLGLDYITAFKTDSHKTAKIIKFS